VDKTTRQALLLACPTVASGVMANHRRLVLWPGEDGDLSRLVGRITLTHIRRWHAHRGSAGQGHLYQGRFTSFLTPIPAAPIPAFHPVARRGRQEYKWQEYGEGSRGRALSG
jgi:hypothetical protein